MGLLLLVSLIWAFSFGLIKGQLSELDSTAVALCRLAFALLLFLPFLRRGKMVLGDVFKLVSIGAVQFGLMYVCYQRAFIYLNAYEVAVYTIFTPIYLALLDAALERKFYGRFVIAALLAVVGAGIIKWRGGTPELGVGFILVQISNFCFAAGQLAYKRLRARLPVAGDAGLFGWLLLGAVLVTGLVSAWETNWAGFHPNMGQWLVMLYLGLLASGACFFWWNLGVTRVNTGILAVFNNVKIPAAVVSSLLVFGERADMGKLICGMALMFCAVWLARER